jgi:serine/threonine protein kinase/Tfp pilus assembly protein PilF
MTDAGRWERLQDLFHRALEVPAAGRDAWIGATCADDPGLAAELRVLLAKADDAGSTLGRVVAEAAGEFTGELGSSLVGTTLGPYRIVERLGTGGMGEVFLAEQDEPVRRRVALKTIRMGMDTREVLRRFETERQALARMNHPAIARVLDAGATPGGRPYFVMDLVAGPSLTEYCDARRLPLDRRLALFLDVVAGVQHAHLQGIIHRDLKPSNVLVEEQDGRPVPKIIDFGIAKAIGDDTRERTWMTVHGRLMGTPAYMSPEQAGHGSEDVDTRTDVYSLGALLFELLTGSPPLDPEELRRAAQDEILRRIREQDPPRPSERVATLGPASEHVTLARATDRAMLRKSLRGDLDWITLRALEKDRRRRYTTPAEMAEDIRRYFRDEAVTAGPPTAGYRARKFVRRHRAGVIAVAAVGLALLAGVAGTTLGMLRAFRAEREARLETKTAESTAGFLEGMFRESYPSRARGRPPDAREILDRGAARVKGELADEPLVRARLMGIIGDVYRDIGEYPQAESLLRSALELRERYGSRDSLALAEAGNRLGILYRVTGRRDSAERYYALAVGIRERHLPPDDLDLAASLNNLGGFYATGRQFDRALPLFRRALAMRERRLAPDDPLVAASHHNLGTVLMEMGQSDSARVYYRKNLDIQERRPGPPGPDLARAYYNLGGLEFDADRYDVARSLYERALAILERVFGPDHVEVSSALLNLGKVETLQNDLAAARPTLARALAIRRRVFGHRSAMVAKVERAQAELIRREGRPAEARRVLEGAMRTFEREDGSETFEVSTTLLGYASCLRDLGDAAGERAALEHALRIREAELSPGDSRIDEVRERIEQLGS